MMRNFLALRFLLFFYLSFCATGDSEVSSISPMEQREQEALYSTLRSFVGNWFNGSELYPDPCGWTPIQGVSCDLFDGTWYVDSMVIGPLVENSLPCARSAKFSPYLFKLKRLRSLTFFDCFHYPISVEGLHWENLANTLETLEFRSNPALTGEIPTGLGSLRKLQSLVLLENDLMGEVPDVLGNLSGLKQLVLAGHRFSGRVPPTLGRLTNLLILDFSRNSLSGSLPTTIGELDSLLKLDLSNNSLDGSLPEEIGKLGNLTLLDLRNNRFSNGLPQSLQEMVSLEEILLSNNPIGGNLSSIDWRTLQNVVILDFANMGLIGEMPDSMAEMKKLRFLALNNNHLSGNVPLVFGDMPCVNALHLNGNNLSGELQFTEGFYEKMGRYFSAWNNPNLCYNGEVVPKENAPSGVKECQLHMPISNSGLKTVVGSEGEAKRSCLSVESCVFSGSGSCRFRRLIVVILMVILVI